MKWLLVSLIPALAVVAALVGLRVYVVTPYTLPTASMEPTIRKGTLFFVYHRAYWNSADVHHGDMIAYWTMSNGQPATFLKRVIGIPGDHITTSGTSVSVNGSPLPQTLVRIVAGTSVYAEVNDRAAYHVQFSGGQKFLPSVDVIVPPESFFVMGDNRSNSLDSRYTGPVRFADIIGRKL